MNNPAPNFSIIIPLKGINDYVRETIAHIKKISGLSWEIIILPNENAPHEWPGDPIKIISTGKVSPAIKRDIGAKISLGEILIFFDDDSYPDDQVLNIAKKYFEDNGVIALGGPAITPPSDKFFQRVSGAVFLSRLSGGCPERYIPIGRAREVDDWPSVNFIIRKNIFLKIGGFNSPYWPGEDTLFCLNLVKSNLGKIIYVPEMIVWHHRRGGLVSHLKQVAAYGLHRGFFSKKFPENSRKLKYFLPSFFFLFFLASLLSYILNIEYLHVFISGWIIYLIALLISLISIAKYEGWKVAIVASGYIFLTHLVYGGKFIQGLFSGNLRSKLR